MAASPKVRLDALAGLCALSRHDDDVQPDWIADLPLARSLAGTVMSPRH